MKKTVISFLLIIIPLAMYAQFDVYHIQQQNSFPLVSNKAVTIYYDSNDYQVVQKSVSLFSEDIFRVTQKKAKLSTKSSLSDYPVIIGTIGHCGIIDKLVESGKLDVTAIKNKWEQYAIKTIDNPFQGVRKALVIAGSDCRATAYGVFSLSEAIGVSPLYWWSDVPVAKSSQLYIKNIDYISKAPSVQYRGIFINDEDWGIKPWASKNFEKKLGDIGPKTYEKVCELILRMKGNMLAPAMHGCTGAFNKYAENKRVADEWGIIMTSSHCEPLLYNNATEWDLKRDGQWNYITNKKHIYDVLDKRVSENSPYENIYTLAMRGIHDSKLVGVPKEKEVSLMEDAINDQRNILARHINHPIDSIPQIFVPYKEVLDIYERGMKLPDDVMLVWPDDNYGYIKRLNNTDEKKRKGGSGIYYHISYCGEPHDYLWLNTTSPALMLEEMKKAYDNGAKRYWLLNVGDIKPGELGMKTFLDMAWDIDSFSFDNINNHQVDFLTKIFGKQYNDDIRDIMSSYYQLAFQRKPEYMGWGYEWNNENSKERNFDTDFSFVNYNEAQDRINEYERISNKAANIWKAMPNGMKGAFYELVYYQVKGASLMNKKMLYAQLNRSYAIQKRAATNSVAADIVSCQDSIEYYNDLYNSILNGKWKYMMSVPPGYTATYDKLPNIVNIDVPEKGGMGITVSGNGNNQSITSMNVLPCINPFTNQSQYIEIYNKGKQSFKWSAVCSQDWIDLSKINGEVEEQDRIIVKVDWTKAPKGSSTAVINISDDSHIEKVFVPVFNPESPTVSELKGIYVEDNGCVSINPGIYNRKSENKDIKIRVVDGIGYENKCVQLGNPFAPSQNVYNTSKAPKVEYDFYTFGSGSVTVYVYALPIFPIDTKHNTRIRLMIDNGMIKFASNNAKEYSSEWRENVIRNSTLCAVNLYVDKPGKHTLKLICQDAGMMVQKIVIDLGGMKRSYLGPKTSLVQ